MTTKKKDGRKAQKARSHEKILVAASRMLREHGPEGVSVDALMKEAGLTRGGFYAHFKSKDALVAAALDRAFTDTIELWFRAGKGAKGAAKRAALDARYLTLAHVKQPEHGCPAPSLAGDVARGSPAMKRVFKQQVDRLADRLARETGASRQRALAQLASLYGAVLLARAVGDDELATEVLEAARA